MKGQSKRFVDHKGEAFKMGFWKRKVFEDRSINFPELWRYATPPERLVTVLAIMLAWLCSCCLVAAILIYGELTSLFVERTKGNSDVERAALLTFFGGGKTSSAPKNDSIHMVLLVDDSIAFGCASLAIMVVQLGSAALAIIMANWTATRMVTRLRWKLLRATLRQELAFFDTNKTFSFANSITEDMEKIRLGTGSHVVMFSYLFGSVVAAAALSLAYGWKLTLAGLSVVPVGLASAAVLAKYQTKYSAQEAAAYGVAGRGVQEALAGIKTVKAYAGEQIEINRYANLLKPAGKAMRKRGLLAGAGAGTGWLLTYALNAIVLAYGAKLVTDDMDLPPNQQEYHPGILVTILFCTFMAAQNIAMCNPHLEIFSGARGAARGIYEMLGRRSDIDALSEGGEKPKSFKGEIGFENIYFNYPARPDVKVLRGFNLRISAGATVALVGQSGCGKSTTLQLLQRLYEPGSGRVVVDGRPLTDLNLHHFRSHIGVVGQEPVLFSGTIRENITRGMADCTKEQIENAARTAHAHEFISNLAEGYDTFLGSGGAQLSGGQKQRIAIARAIIRQPAILLLDEPTSALDPPSEKKVQAALDNASVGRTTLVVSHRLSTIVNADMIVYMEQGAALEQGTYTELLEKKGLFWKLVQDDMSSKPAAQPSAAQQEERTKELEEIQQFKREFRQASLRSIQSLSERKPAARGSHRVGNVHAAHIPNVAAPDIISAASVVEELETEPITAKTKEEAFPPVSTWQLLKLNAPEWRLLAIGGVASFMIGAAMPAFALLFSKLYGMFALEDKELIMKQATLYACLFICVAALCGLVTFLQGWLLNLAGSRLTNRLRVQTFSSFLRQEQGWLDLPTNSVGALCARLASDCAAVQGATGTRLGTVLQGVSTMAIGVSLAMAYSWKMTLVSLLSVPCVMGGIYLEGYIMKKAEVNEKRALELASRVATEAVINIRTVQSLSIEKPLLAKYAAALDDAQQQGRNGRLVRGPVYGLCLCAPTLGYAVSLAYGGYLIAREGLRYEYAILVSEALIYGAWMLAEALSFAPNFAAARRSGARIIYIMNREPAIVSEPGVNSDPNWKAEGDIQYAGVEFRYPTRRNVPVLQGLDLHIEKGTTVALVGSSGCGKSTLLQILMRLYDADRGTVHLDGMDTRRDLTLPHLRAQLGLVQQEPVLFDRSVRENIAYGDTSRAVPDAEVVRAAEQANVHAFIASLPLGYDTNLGSGGAQLSGGQKQRIAIARALVRNPKILLLDEATSALDANSEKIVQAALEAASVGRTTIMIAHRLATVRHADKICVIVTGKVAEMGSHDELVKLGGHYLQLLNEQGVSY